jgi:hypothetical protein
LMGEPVKGGNQEKYQNNQLLYGRHKKLNDRFGIGFGVTAQGESNIKNDKPGLILPDYTRVDFAAYSDLADDLSIQLKCRKCDR